MFFTFFLNVNSYAVEQNSSRVDHLGILVEQKNNKLVITKSRAMEFFI